MPACVAAGILPLTGGGDHLCTLPILRALAKGRPLGMIQFDSHTDLNDVYFGTSRYNHGTPFRRAVEEGLLDPKRYVIIGIRGTAYGREDWDFAAVDRHPDHSDRRVSCPRGRGCDGRGARDRGAGRDLRHL